MRPVATSQAKIDLIATREELGQLAILGAFLARDVLITATEEERDHGSQVAITSRGERFIEEEIASLVAICGVVRDQSVDQVLDEVRRLLKQWTYPVEGKPSDNRPFGAGLDDGPGDD
jgi:hypothetical protein